MWTKQVTVVQTEHQANDRFSKTKENLQCYYFCLQAQSPGGATPRILGPPPPPPRGPPANS